MKIVLAILAAMAVGRAPVFSGPAPRADMQVGEIRTGDRLYNRTYLTREPIYNVVQTQDYVYSGNTTSAISAVLATEIGGTQYGTAWVLQGGLGANNVTVRVQSAQGLGYYYMIEVWGR